MIVQCLINGIAAGAVIALVALGFALIHKVARFFHFAHGALIALGGYAVVAAVMWARLPLVVAVVLAVLCAGLVGVMLDAVVYARMRRRQASVLTLLLASLGIYAILQNGMSIAFGDERRVVSAWCAPSGFEVFGAHVVPTQMTNIAASMAACLALALLFRRTTFGTTVRAIANDRELAMCFGVRTERAIRLVFFVGSALGGLAGALIVIDMDVSPNTGFRALLLGGCAYMLGGLKRPFGAVFGGLAVGILEQLSAGLLPVQWQDFLMFLALLGIALVRPGVGGEARIRKREG